MDVRKDKRQARKGQNQCLCGCGKYFKPKSKNHHFYTNKCRYRFWNPIRRDLNKLIKKFDHVSGIILDQNKVILELSQFTAGLDKRIKALEGLETIRK